MRPIKLGPGITEKGYNLARETRLQMAIVRAELDLLNLRFDKMAYAMAEDYLKDPENPRYSLPDLAQLKASISAKRTELGALEVRLEHVWEEGSK
jgi:hypothetical protein